jgi:hypothetical protein
LLTAAAQKRRAKMFLPWICQWVCGFADTIELEKNEKGQFIILQ